MAEPKFELVLEGRTLYVNNQVWLHLIIFEGGCVCHKGGKTMRGDGIRKRRDRGNTWGTSCKETLSDDRKTRLTYDVRHKLICDLTLSICCSTLTSVLRGSPAPRDTSRKTGKWPLQALVRVFAPTLRGNRRGVPYRNAYAPPTPAKWLARGFRRLCHGGAICLLAARAAKKSVL